MKNNLSTLEKIAALLAAANCLISPVGMGLAQVRPGESLLWLFPLPLLYLIEIAAAGIFGWIAIAREEKLGKDWRWMPWITSGILSAFVILGGFSIGPSLIPATLIFLVLAILQNWRHGENLITHTAALILAALAQGSVMLFLVYIW